MPRDNKHGNEAGAGGCRDVSTAVLSESLKMRLLVALLEEVRLWAAKRIDAELNFVLNSYRQFQNVRIITSRHGATILYMHIKVCVTTEVQKCPNKNDLTSLKTTNSFETTIRFFKAEFIRR